MASDSKCTDDYGMFLTKIQKLYRLANKSVVGTAGDADSRELLDLLGRATLKRLPSRADLAATKTNFHGLWAFPNGTLFGIYIEPVDRVSEIQWSGELVEIVERWAAVGSGSGYAMGAMLAGKNASEAVGIACKLDSNCQMPIKSVVVKDTTKVQK